MTNADTIPLSHASPFAIAEARALAALSAEWQTAADLWEHGSEARASDTVSLATMRDALRVLCAEGKAVELGGRYRRAQAVAA